MISQAKKQNNILPVIVQFFKLWRLKIDNIDDKLKLSQITWFLLINHYQKQNLTHCSEYSVEHKTNKSILNYMLSHRMYKHVSICSVSGVQWPS